MTKTSLELVMEAVASSDQVTLEDMEKMDIREKITLQRLEEGNFCPICMLGLGGAHNDNCADKSELNKIMETRRLKSSNDVIDTIEKIYYNPIANIEAITYICTIDESKIFELAMKAAKESIIFRMMLLEALNK